MGIGIVKKGRVETVFGNIADQTDLSVIKDEILSVYRDVYKGVSGESAIYSTYGRYDILSLVPSLNVLRTIVPTALELVGLDPSKHKFKAWFNVCFEGEFLARHTHETTNHGYMVVTNYGSRTIFELEEMTVAFKNEPGQVLHLFGRYYHAVTPNPSKEPRITVAWDVLRKTDTNTKLIYYDL
jgi:hypothetical protein